MNEPSKQAQVLRFLCDDDRTTAQLAEFGRSLYLTSVMEAVREIRQRGKPLGIGVVATPIPDSRQHIYTLVVPQDA
jgi:hypothetical protein